MERMTLSKATEEQVKSYAKKHKISYQKACEKLFDIGVCHLQKKINAGQTLQSNSFSFDIGVCHPRRITRTITITEIVEVA